jgi:hypothetical protein
MQTASTMTVSGLSMLSTKPLAATSALGLVLLLTVILILPL